MTQVVAKEVAVAEVERWLSALDIDESALDPSDKDGVEAVKELVAGSIVRGKCTVDESGTKLLFASRTGLKVTIREPIGKDFMQGQVPDVQTRMCRVIASMNECDPSKIQSLPQREILFLDRIVGFLATVSA